MSPRIRKKSLNNVGSKRKEKALLLKTLLLTRNHSIEDLKTEVALIVCHHLFTHYIKREEARQTEDNLIYKEIKAITNYLEDEVVTVDTLESILITANKNKITSPDVRCLDVYIQFYNSLSIFLRNELDSLKTNQIILKEWYPVMAFTIIEAMKKEKNYSFRKWNLIKEYDTQKVFSKYNEINIKLKRSLKEINKDPNKKFFSIRTPITEMEDIGLKLVEKITTYKYVK